VWFLISMLLSTSILCYYCILSYVPMLFL
jgi:hypothetical protein